MQWGGGGIRRKDLQNERCKYISGQRIFNFAENALRWDFHSVLESISIFQVF